MTPTITKTKSLRNFYFFPHSGFLTGRRKLVVILYVINFLEFASLMGLLLYSIWSCLWLSIKALVVQ
jgi:hypothetical protein